MQLHENEHNGGKLTLTIAGDSGVPLEVVSHLKSVFGQLREIADRCHQFYKNEGMNYSLRQRDKSPHSGEALATSTQLVADLKSSLYRHSLEKFISRINKYYKEFMAFIRRLQEHRTQASEEASEEAEASKVAQGSWNALLRVRHSMEFIVEMLLPTDFKYDELVTRLDALQEYVRDVLKSKTDIAMWLEAAKGKHAFLGCVCIFHLTKQPWMDLCFLSSAISIR